MVSLLGSSVPWASNNNIHAPTCVHLIRVELRGFSSRCLLLFPDQRYRSKMR